MTDDRYTGPGPRDEDKFMEQGHPPYGGPPPHVQGQPPYQPYGPYQPPPGYQPYPPQTFFRHSDPIIRLSPLRVFIVFIVILILAVVLSIPVMVMALFTSGSTDDFMTFLQTPLTLFILLLIQDTIFVAVPYFVYIRTKIFTWVDMGLEWEDFLPRMGAGLISGLGLSAIVIVAVVAIGYDTTGGVPVFAEMSWTTFVILLLGGSIVAPIAEEIFFRGIAFKGVQKYLEFRNVPNAMEIALLYSSVIFAAVHFYDTVGSVVVFVGGLVFALLYHKTGSIIPSFFAHAAYNTGVITATFIGAI